MVTVADALKAAQIDVGLVPDPCKTPPPPPISAFCCACDVNQQDSITSVDALIIAGFAAGLDDPDTCNAMCVLTSIPACSITLVTGTTGDITIDLDVTAGDGTIMFQYSTNGGMSFTPATNAPGSTYSSGMRVTAPISGTFVWDSLADLTAVCLLPAQFRIVIDSVAGAGSGWS